MTYNSILAGLYYMLIYADGNVNGKEIASIKQMTKAEGLIEEEFNIQIRLLDSKDKAILFSECMLGLKELSHDQQIRIVAWLCVAANADGFMERTEWQLIYKIYHKELNLPLNEIFNVQKELNKLIWEQSTLTIL
jgi:uncharacterized tellurite resistance protein B-like protein